MGDRGNIVVQADGGEVWLYSHWGGTEIPENVARSLDRARDRWTDSPYLARVLFDDLRGTDTGTSGFGISHQQGDGGTEVYVNVDEQLVRYADGRDAGYSFDEFVAAYLPDQAAA